MTRFVNNVAIVFESMYGSSAYVNEFSYSQPLCCFYQVSRSISIYLRSCPGICGSCDFSRRTVDDDIAPFHCFFDLRPVKDIAFNQFYRKPRQPYCPLRSPVGSATLSPKSNDSISASLVPKKPEAPTISILTGSRGGRIKWLTSSVCHG